MLPCQGFSGNGVEVPGPRPSSLLLSALEDDNQLGGRSESDSTESSTTLLHRTNSTGSSSSSDSSSLHDSTTRGSRRRRQVPSPLILEPPSSSNTSVIGTQDHQRTPRYSRTPTTAVPLHHSLAVAHSSASSTLLTPSTLLISTMPGGWVAEQQRTRSPLAEGAPHHTSFPGLRPSSTTISSNGFHPGSPPSATTSTSSPSSSTRLAQTHRTIATPQSPMPTVPSTSSLSGTHTPPQIVPSGSTRSSPSYSQTLASPCFVHNHLDHSLNDIVKRDAAAAAAASLPRKMKNRKEEVKVNGSGGGGGAEGDQAEPGSETASEGDEQATYGSSEEEEEGHNLTRALAETAVSVREMSKQLGRARVVSHIQSVMIITKARDNHLIRLTRELAQYLMQTPRNGKDRGLVVYVDSQLKKSKRFDAEGLELENPELFRPLPRRYSRTSSSASLAGSVVLDQPLKRMTQLSQLSDAMKRAASPDPNHRKADGTGEEGQLRYWTNEMCTKSPHLFDFVVTLGGDGTVLYASWLFQHVVPPVIPFALGSLGFLTNFDFSSYAYTLNHAIDNGIRVNLRMRFTCTVYRAIEGEENKKRRAMKSGKTGGIFMNSLNKDGWQSIESGASGERSGGGKGKGKDKEIKCFVTRAVESFEVLNDLVVDRGPSPYVSLLELFGDEHHMTTVQADGLTVSTPTGSTAYSLSAGGSLVHPEIPALLITPICPHTLSFRPMLLPDSMELRICVPYNSRSTAWASFDGRGRVELRQGDHIKVTASQYPFPTVCADNQSTDWFNSISRTLKWNERERQKSFVVVEEGRQKKEEGILPVHSSAKLSRQAATEQAKADFGDEENDDSGDEEDDEEEEDEEEEEEAFDIDDLSSENHTNSSSPAFSPSDPTSVVPPLTSAHSQTSSSYNHDRDMSAASSVELHDDATARFRDPAPRPPRLSSRHSALDTTSTSPPSISSSAPQPPTFYSQARMSSSTRARRERGEEGDRDHLRESLQVKRNVGGQRRPGKSQERGGAQQGKKAEQDGNDRAFAVVGMDSDTSENQSGSDDS